MTLVLLGGGGVGISINENSLNHEYISSESSFGHNLFRQ